MNDDMTDVDQCIDEILANVKTTIAAKELSKLLMIGIHTGGVWIAERLHKELDLQHPLGKLNIAFYRDDFSRIGTHPQVTPSKLPFDVEDKHKPLTDEKLANILKEKGYLIARRTVAKYREQQGLPVARLRKEL